MIRRCNSCAYYSTQSGFPPCNTCGDGLPNWRFAESPERKVIERIEARLDTGRAQYGPLDVHDGRDWLEEAIQEAADLLIYLECLKEQRDGGK